MENMLVKLNQKQIEKLSDIAADIGLVALASIIFPSIFNKFNLVEIFLGGLATVFF